MAKKRITQDLIDDVKRLAEMGLQNFAICEATGLGATTLSRNTKIRAALHEGRKAAREAAIERLNGIAEADASTAFRIAERLGCFRQSLDVERPTNIQGAVALMGEAIKRYSHGEIPETVAKTIEGMCNSYIKALEVADLDQRLERVEKMLDRLEKENAATR